MAANSPIFKTSGRDLGERCSLAGIQGMEDRCLSSWTSVSLTAEQWIVVQGKWEIWLNRIEKEG